MLIVMDIMHVFGAFVRFEFAWNEEIRNNSFATHSATKEQMHKKQANRLCFSFVDVVF